MAPPIEIVEQVAGMLGGEDLTNFVRAFEHSPLYHGAADRVVLDYLQMSPERIRRPIHLDIDGSDGAGHFLMALLRQQWKSFTDAHDCQPFKLKFRCLKVSLAEASTLKEDIHILAKFLGHLRYQLEELHLDLPLPMTLSWAYTLLDSIRCSGVVCLIVTGWPVLGRPYCRPDTPSLPDTLEEVSLSGACASEGKLAQYFAQYSKRLRSWKFSRARYVRILPNPGIQHLICKIPEYLYPKDLVSLLRQSPHIKLLIIPGDRACKPDPSFTFKKMPWSVDASLGWIYTLVRSAEVKSTLKRLTVRPLLFDLPLSAGLMEHCDRLHACMEYCEQVRDLKVVLPLRGMWDRPQFSSTSKREFPSVTIFSLAFKGYTQQEILVSFGDS